MVQGCDAPAAPEPRVVASLLGVGSAATFFSLGAWLVAGAGATASLAIYSIHVNQSRPPYSPSGS
jgi:hypothetical protein